MKPVFDITQSTVNAFQQKALEHHQNPTEKEYPKCLKLFLRSLNFGNLTCEASAYHPFIELVAREAFERKKDSIYYKVLMVCRSRFGLYESTFGQNILLAVYDSETGEEISLGFSKELLLLFYPNLYNAFKWQFSEAVNSKIVLPQLSKESLMLFYEYFYHGKVSSANLKALCELLAFADLHEDQELESKTYEAIFITFIDEPSLFDPDLIREYVSEFTSYFFTLNSINFSQLNSGHFRISLKDFIQIFSEKDPLKRPLLDFIKDAVDSIIINDENSTGLFPVEENYRKAIVFVNLSDLTNCTLNHQDYKNFRFLFPNANFSIHFYSYFELKESKDEALKCFIAGKSKQYQENKPAAIECFKKALSFKDDFFSYVALANLVGDKKELIELLERAFIVNPKGNFDYYWLKAALCENLDEAIQFGRMALEINPKVIIANHTLASYLKKMGKFEEAKVYFFRFVRLDGLIFDDYPIDSIFEFFDLLDLNEFRLIKKLIQKNTLRNTNHNLLTFLAEIYKREGKFREAEKELLKVVYSSSEKTPIRALAYALLGEIQFNKEQVDRAQKSLQTAYEIDKKNPLIFWIRGNIEMSISPDKAFVQFAQALYLSPKNPKFLFSMAQCKLRLVPSQNLEQNKTNFIAQAKIHLSEAFSVCKTDPKIPAMLYDLQSPEEKDNLLKEMGELFDPYAFEKIDRGDITTLLRSKENADQTIIGEDHKRKREENRDKKEKEKERDEKKTKQF